MNRTTLNSFSFFEKVWFYWPQLHSFQYYKRSACELWSCMCNCIFSSYTYIFIWIWIFAYSLFLQLQCIFFVIVLTVDTWIICWCKVLHNFPIWKVPSTCCVWYKYRTKSPFSLTYLHTLLHHMENTEAGLQRPLFLRNRLKTTSI